MYASKLNLLINFAILFQIISSRVKILASVIIQMCSNQSNVLNLSMLYTITKSSPFMSENLRFLQKLIKAKISFRYLA